MFVGSKISLGSGVRGLRKGAGAKARTSQASSSSFKLLPGWSSIGSQSFEKIGDLKVSRVSKLKVRPFQSFNFRQFERLNVPNVWSLPVGFRFGLRLATEVEIVTFREYLALQVVEFENLRN